MTELELNEITQESDSKALSFALRKSKEVRQKLVNAKSTEELEQKLDEIADALAITDSKMNAIFQCYCFWVRRFNNSCPCRNKSKEKLQPPGISETYLKIDWIFYHKREKECCHWSQNGSYNNQKITRPNTTEVLKREKSQFRHNLSKIKLSQNKIIANIPNKLSYFILGAGAKLSLMYSFTPSFAVSIFSKFFFFYDFVNLLSLSTSTYLSTINSM